MSKLSSESLAKLYQALGNSRRIQIIFLLEKENFTITEIAKRLNIGIGRTSNYVSILESQNLIQKIRKDNTVIVKSLVLIREDGEIIRKDKIRDK
ncbi:winged helix-turn-helix transcriptional regulator [Candidatus Woesearchaeota archaeon]|nr:winged helix-turn-helix transcriptional regulator [Candidatus Woesearchaeota archaeon]